MDNNKYTNTEREQKKRKLNQKNIRNINTFQKHTETDKKTIDTQQQVPLRDENKPTERTEKKCIRNYNLSEQSVEKPKQTKN